MNNPGVDRKIWERIFNSIIDHQQAGHDVKVSCKRVLDENQKTLLFDMIQTVDGEIMTETVLRQPLENLYEAAGVDDHSMEGLVRLYKDKIDNLRRAAGGRSNATVIVTMTPRSVQSGELRGILIDPDSDGKTSVLVNYSHYCLLRALRDKMAQVSGAAWKQVKAVSYAGEVQFYFNY